MNHFTKVIDRRSSLDSQEIGKIHESLHYGIFFNLTIFDEKHSLRIVYIAKLSSIDEFYDPNYS